MANLLKVSVHTGKQPNPQPKIRTPTTKPRLRKLFIYGQILLVAKDHCSCIHEKSGVVCPPPEIVSRMNWRVTSFLWVVLFGHNNVGLTKK